MLIVTKLLFAVDNCNSTHYEAEKTRFPSMMTEYKTPTLCGNDCERDPVTMCSNSAKLLTDKEC
jgi:hypothetical protein